MNKNTKVVILCGGMGERLREETEYKPKPMIEIGNKPILWHIMKTYAHYGFKEFILCLGYKGKMIKDYFYNYGINRDFTVDLETGNISMEYKCEEDWKVTLVDTGENTMKGYRIKQIERYITSDTFMLTYGDGIANINISSLMDFHKKCGYTGTVTGVNPPSRFGEITHIREKVLNFSEKPQTSNGLINGGFFVFNKNIFNYLSNNPQCDFEFHVLNKLALDNNLCMYDFSQNENKWACMDTMRDVKYLNDLWNNNKAFWKVWD